MLTITWAFRELSFCWWRVLPWYWYLWTNEGGLIYLFIFGCTRSSLQHGLFSSCRERELPSSFGVRASDCGGFSLQNTGSRALGLQKLWHMGSVVVASGLWSTGSIIAAHGLSCSEVCAILLDQGLKLFLLQEDHHWATRESPRWTY